MWTINDVLGNTYLFYRYWYISAKMSLRFYTVHIKLPYLCHYKEVCIFSIHFLEEYLFSKVLENSAPSIQEQVKMVRVRYLIQNFSFQFSVTFFVLNREKFLVTPLIVNCLYTYGHRVLYTQCSKTSCICGMYYGCI